MIGGSLPVEKIKLGKSGILRLEN